MVPLPPDIESVIDRSWEKTNRVPGHLGENEARFLGLLAACVPAEGVILEIGSFKGKSTVMLASVSSHYQRSPVVAIDPHTAPSVTDPKTEKGSSTFEEFKESLDKAQVTSSVEVHRAYSAEIAKSWNRPIRLLWIDGDHTYQGVRQDFGNYSPFLAPGGIVAFHDCLNAFEGPIRVFTESVLRDNRFGASGFVQSIGWSQLLPAHTHTLSLSLSLSLSKQRGLLERRASRLLPFLANGKHPRGLSKIAYKLARSRIPRLPISPAQWAAMIS